MNKEKNESRFWKTVERFSTVLSILSILGLLPIIGAIWGLIQQGFQTTVPAWSVISGSIASLILGLVVSRRSKSNPKRNEKNLREEFFNALWELDKKSDTVNGPLCKTCLVKMVPVYKRDTRANKNYFIFACHNPECINRGAITNGLTVEKVEDALQRAYEQFQAQERKKEVVKSKGN